jgi:hypothetical protein
MNKEDFESLQCGMAEASAFLRGARDSCAVHEPADVRTVRARTAVTGRDAPNATVSTHAPSNNGSKAAAAPNAARKCTSA